MGAYKVQGRGGMFKKAGLYQISCLILGRAGSGSTRRLRVAGLLIWLISERYALAGLFTLILLRCLNLGKTVSMSWPIGIVLLGHIKTILHFLVQLPGVTLEELE